MYPESDVNRRASYQQYLPAGLTWRFHHWIYRGSAYIDDYYEFSTASMSWSPDERLVYSYDALDRLQAVATDNDPWGYGQAFTYDALGNLQSKTQDWATVNYTYPPSGAASVRPHAAIALGANSYAYDANGNMTQRIEAGVTYTQTWDVENRLISVVDDRRPITTTTTFVYDADGQRVQKLQNGVTTVYVGRLWEKNLSTGAITTYYQANGRALAQRQGGTVSYFVGDQLGSTSLTIASTGSSVGWQRYTPYGTPRQASGDLRTDYRFTGQRSEEAYLGSLYDYNARFYSPALGRFISADTIVPDPGNPQSLNRYTYGLGNPVKYRDPSGHWVESALDIAGIIFDANDIRTNGLNWENGLSLAADIGGLILPGVTGGGVLVRAVAHADDVVDVARTAAHAGDAASVIDRVTDAGKALLSKGARGAASGREFDAAKSVIPIRKLSTGNVKITDKGIDAVQKHLARFGKDSPNEVMVDRLRKIAAGEIEAAESDINFYTHELREYTRYRQAGWATGQPFDADEAYDLWNNLHTATLEDYGLLDDPSLLYSADAGVP